MPNLVILGFDGLRTADEVLDRLRGMQQEYLIDLEDACVIERDARGKVYLKQAVNMTSLGASVGGMKGAMLGTLMGLLFLNPLAGFAVGTLTGAGLGALAGSASRMGISDDFLRNLGGTIPPGSSALAVVFRSVNEDKVLPELAGYKPRVLKTSFSDEAERQFAGALGPALAETAA
jgi:uncharacterized membrane protein